MKERRGVEFSLEDFHHMYLNDKKFIRLYDEWIKSGKEKLKKPSIDRISNKGGYTIRNIHMITWAENRHKQTMERRSRKGVVIQYSNGKEIARFKSQRDAVHKTGISQSCISKHMRGLAQHCKGFTFKYLNDAIKKGELA